METIFINVCLSKTNFENSKDDWRLLSACRHSSFCWWPSLVDGREWEHCEAWCSQRHIGIGVWESSLFLMLPLFSPQIWSTSFAGLSASAFCCACALPYLVAYHHPCHTVPSCMFPSAWAAIQPTGQRRKVSYWWLMRKGPDDWTPFEWRRSGRIVSTEKTKKRERWVSSTNFCGQECQVTLPVLLQQLLLSPIPVHAPPCAQKQQNLRETHTQTHCFSITLSSWTGCIMVPLLAATSFCGTEQHCLVSFLLSGVLLQECCTILYPKNSNPKIVFLCLSRCMDMSCSLSAGQVLPIFCFLSWFSSAKSIQTAVLLSQGQCVSWFRLGQHGKKKAFQSLNKTQT